MKVMLRRRFVRKLLAVLTLVCICGAWQTIALGNLQSASHLSLTTEGKSKHTKQVEVSPPQSPANCEDALGALDDAVIRVQQLKGSYLIIIARLGNKEKSARLNRIRLAL